MANDKDKVKMICTCCGKLKEISYGRYRHINDKSKWICSDCNRKNWYKNMSNEEKERFKELHKNYYKNLSDSDKEKRSKESRERYQNYSKDKKDMLAKISSERKKEYWANITDEELEKIRETSSKRFVNYWKNIPTDKLNEIKNKMSKSQKERWKNLSESEYKRWQKISCEKMTNWWRNSTPEKIEEMKNKVSKSVKRWWENLSREEYEKWNEARINGCKKYSEIMSWNIMKTESEFMNLLNRYGIKYDFRWYNRTKHQDFDTLFPSNPVTKYPSVSPFREWDFRINTKSKSILVDVDGSIHDPSKTNYEVTYITGEKIILRDHIQFNDSKRPYQTDGLDAYVIQCYDDKLTYESIVINVTSGKRMTLDTFMSMIASLDMSKHELAEFIKYIETY